ncbi:unnamed protein product [Chrysodeixis includens]|uniref:Histidine-rich glycoprotein-like n=1 Tax=Chrysodeixis includens TaxID=689277 RepID=A0A9N8Q0G5_CHRIL|nr:unnamed protein product [Chrysodeixis includens]
MQYLQINSYKMNLHFLNNYHSQFGNPRGNSTNKKMYKVILIAALVATVAALPQYGHGHGHNDHHGHGHAISSQSVVLHQTHPTHHEEHHGDYHHEPIHHEQYHHEPIHHEQHSQHQTVHHQEYHHEPVHHVAYHHQPIHHEVNHGHASSAHHGHATEQHVDYHAHPKYEFSYQVSDPHTHDIKSQHEARDGDVVNGAYSLHQPDGTVRVVEYHSDHQTGFNADVKIEGHAQHIVPEHHHHHY